MNADVRRRTAAMAIAALPARQGREGALLARWHAAKQGPHFRWRVTGTGSGSSGVGRSGAGRRILMAEGRSADSREADFPGAVTCHLFRVLVRVDECGRAAANGGDGNRRPTLRGGAARYWWLAVGGWERQRGSGRPRMVGPTSRQRMRCHRIPTLKTAS